MRRVVLRALIHIAVDVLIVTNDVLMAVSQRMLAAAEWLLKRRP